MKLYLPISSQNFNAIFSTESISPPSFYVQRNFGIRRHARTDYALLDDFLFFYSVPVFFRLDGSTAEAYPMLLVIDRQYLHIDYLSEHETPVGKIIVYQKTIYLNMVHFELWFHNNQEKESVLARAEAGLEVKTVDKYKDSFRVINPNHLSHIDIQRVPRIELRNPIITNEIRRDKAFNHFKGLIFGYLIGHIGQKSQSEIEFSMSLQDIINNFANLRTGIGINTTLNAEKYESRKYPKGKSSKTKYSGHNERVSSTKIDNFALLKDTIDCINKSENLFISLFGERPNSKGILLKYLQSITTIPHEQRDLMTFIKVLNSIPDFYSLLYKDALKQYGSNNDIDFDSLRFIVKDYASNNFTHSRSGYDADEEVKTIIYNLEKFAETYFNNTKRQNSTPDLTCFVYDIADQIQIQYDKFNSQVSREDIQLYEEIVKVLLEYPKVKTGEVEKLEILEIIGRVGKRWNNLPKINTQAIQDLRALYAFLNNKSDFYHVENLKSVVLSNFTAFVFKPNSIEEMQMFIETKGIKNSYLAYSFWCTYNGFASLSKTFTQAVFSSGNLELNNILDRFFAQILHINIAQDDYENLNVNQQGNIFDETKDFSRNIKMTKKSSKQQK